MTLILSGQRTSAKPFNPLDISNEVCVCDVSDPSTLTVQGGGALSDGSEINNWADQTSNGHDFTQGTTGRYPLYRAAQDGYPALEFDGSNDNMAVTWGSQVSQPFTMCVVARFRNNGSGDNITDGINSTNRQLLRNNSSAFRWFTGSSNVTHTTVAQDNAWHVFLVTGNGGSGIFRIDGAQVSSGTAGSNPSDGIRLGTNSGASGAFLDGWIRWFGFWDKVLPADEIQKIEQYLGGKFGIDVGRDNFYYVDTVNGNDSTQAGNTIANPLATVDQALTNIGTNNGTILLTAGVSNPCRESVVHSAAGQVSIMPATPSVPYYWEAANSVSSGWSLVSGNVYNRAHGSTTPRNVVLRNLIQVIGDKSFPDTRFVENEATPTTPGTGEFGTDGGNLYINLGGIDPNLVTIDYDSGNSCIRAQSSSIMGISGGIFKYGSTGTLRMDTGGNMHVQDCTVQYGGVLGCIATVGVSPYCCVLRVTVERARNDGLNHHGDPAEANLMIVRQCACSYNDDEGISPHDDCVIEVYDTVMNYNGSGGFAAVNNSITTIMENCAMFFNQRTNASSSEAGLGFLESTVSGVVRNCIVNSSDGRNIRVVSGANVTLTDVTSTNGGLPDDINT